MIFGDLRCDSRLGRMFHHVASMYYIFTRTFQNGFLGALKKKKKKKKKKWLPRSTKKKKKKKKMASSEH